ncbi:MAG: helix-turn-helix domain-containing protein [Tenericutes bacterium]|nr:helix-turn-helix domain-containing protein [Mycoplasmatota bacterium]
MNLGKKIAELRKKNNLSQEELAEKVGVARQTISKWEIGDTTPDINQVKIISKIFNISIDELVDNDINNVIVEKVSNTEKLAGITIKILKVFGIMLIVFITLIFLFVIIFMVDMPRNDYDIVGRTKVSCNLDNEKYVYEAEYNKNYQVINSGGDAYIMNHTDIESYEDVNKIVAHIEDYFNDHGGKCTIVNDN